VGVCASSPLPLPAGVALLGRLDDVAAMAQRLCVLERVRATGAAVDDVIYLEAFA
jgi:hypothetical protein